MSDLPRLLVRITGSEGAIEIVAPVCSITIAPPLPPLGAARKGEDTGELDTRTGVRVAWRPFVPGESATTRIYTDVRQLADYLTDKGRPVRPLP